MNQLISIQDLNIDEIEEIFTLAKKLKIQQKKGNPKQLLQGKNLAMIFNKPSVRTRVSFDVAMSQLGGHTIYMADDIQFGKRESIADIARTLSRYVDGIMIRTFDHQNVVDLAWNASVPVINGLTDLCHPCQALSDVFSIREKFGRLDKVKVAYIGDGNNVARSLINLAAILNLDLHISSPHDYQPETEIILNAKTVRIWKNPVDAVKNADVVYTDTWTSMGQEDEATERAKAFSAFQLNRELLNNAKSDALVMHCLPAHRGMEITDEVIDSPQSIVFDQAENRLHVQKAILVLLMNK
ncbi:MAG: ornithine carbamoyltransferase [Candidatus Margulisiibacteriota bacterium]